MNGCDKTMIAVGLITAGMSLFSWGYDQGRDRTKKEAVIAGVAHYVGDPKTGKSEFKFITAGGAK